MAQKIKGKTKSLRSEREARRRQEFRQSIMQAAERIMTTRGYTALTMDDVAREAQFSKATVYHYFSSKSNLVLELFLDYFDRFYKEILRIKAESAEIKEKLRQIINYYLHFHREKESLSRILMVDKFFLQKMRLFAGQKAASFSRIKRDPLAELKSQRNKILKEVAAMIGEGIEKGEIRSLDPAEATQLIEALLQGFIHRRYWSPSRLSPEKETELLLDFILHGLGSKPASEKGA